MRLILKPATLGRRLFHISPLQSIRGPVGHDGWFPRDHAPGPYPVTDEERRRSAMKYGLRPEDYEPMDQNDPYQNGEYPELGRLTFAQKDPYDYYTNKWYFRNWGEQVQKYFIDDSPWKIQGGLTGLDQEFFWGPEALRTWLQILIPLALLGSWLYYVHNAPYDKQGMKWVNPKLPWQSHLDYYRGYPWNDPQAHPIVNYAFDPIDDEEEVDSHAHKGGH
ncbi:NADH-ubiquinone oxidoreductase ASHI subunit (CI-ASHI or NDUFB8) domain-containing protein [Ditylenchus destructor]|uniref:NADH-ubiquinone oxidoreductase ASHI subunit (CI-ASHI or NDUFB8) domain-containing protein n=1 Tax=Ditylenchus destructor TaxID=166010 RepID=A0AAD4MUX9_9BILA|nr:NADH-ubiquinone oxidoreductase ASHI subunit (CI-ASHI or NDUFB8) domain-containing protein [Ditylenchus destructor]